MTYVALYPMWGTSDAFCRVSSARPDDAVRLTKAADVPKITRGAKRDGQVVAFGPACDPVSRDPMGRNVVPDNNACGDLRAQKDNE